MPNALFILIPLALVYLVGILVKKRFPLEARLHTFAAYEPDGDAMQPARTCSRFRFYNRLFKRWFLPRITSAFSFVPFAANRIKIRDFRFKATARLWEENASVLLMTPKGNFQVYRVNTSSAEIPTDETAVARNALIPAEEKDGGFLMRDGDVIAVREGRRYTFFYCLFNKGTTPPPK